MRIYLDIETVKGLENPTIDQLEKNGFVRKFTREFQNKDLTAEDWIKLYHERAALYAEFGKIVCVSMGYVNEAEQIVLKSFASTDERALLEGVAITLNKTTSLVAHNGLNFDYPWLCRRMIINGVRIPDVLDTRGKKPWEISLLDTAKDWQFNQWNYHVSLSTLCELLGLPSPKAGMDGSQVGDVYYNEKDLEKIKNYCEGDIVALINVHRVMNYQQPIIN
jgi:3'-5' exonuclease